MALPATWRVAESIKTLQRQLRPLAPAAPAVAFGTIADSVHAETSQHYPKIYPGLGSTPVVCAGDFPKAGSLNPRAVLDAIRLSRDPRVLYGISQGQQFSSYPAHGYPPYTWRPYSGSDGHFDHGHLSVVGDKRADDPRLWQISPTPQGDNDMTPDESNLLTAVAWRVDSATFGADKIRGGPYAGEPNWLVQQVKALVAAQAASAQREADMLAAIGALAAGGGNTDTAAIVSVINARTADVTGLLTAQAERIAALETELADFHTDQARAAQAAAAALTE